MATKSFYYRVHPSESLIEIYRVTKALTNTDSMPVVSSDFHLTEFNSKVQQLSAFINLYVLYHLQNLFRVE